MTESPIMDMDKGFTWAAFERWLVALENDDYRKEHGDGESVLQLRKKCKGTRAHVLPGLTGRLVAWGDGTWEYPSVVFVKLSDCRKVLDRTRELFGLQDGEPVPDVAYAVSIGGGNDMPLLPGSSLGMEPLLLCLPCAEKENTEMMYNTDGHARFDEWCPLVDIFTFQPGRKRQQATCPLCEKGLPRTEAQALLDQRPFTTWRRA